LVEASPVRGKRILRVTRASSIVRIPIFTLASLVATSFEDESLPGNGEASAEALSEPLKRFQRRHGLDADGRVGPGTLTALDVPASFRVEQIAAN
jgi:murein L,D-transpeptidase YcbB/YkuD